MNLPKNYDIINSRDAHFYIRPRYRGIFLSIPLYILRVHGQLLVAGCRGSIAVWDRLTYNSRWCVVTQLQCKRPIVILSTFFSPFVPSYSFLGIDFFRLNRTFMRRCRLQSSRWAIWRNFAVRQLAKLLPLHEFFRSFRPRRRMVAQVGLLGSDSLDASCDHSVLDALESISSNV